ncbi:MAG: alpha/beta hydrolase [Clostridia bacterium]|nr:alpha/beta hydrolase [Clostridia bacterium]
MITTSTFTTSSGKQLALYVWDKVEQPRMVLQLVHGMCEHSARYDDFARYLNNNGIIVVMVDQRGHGLSTTPDSYGYEEGDMWTNNVNDQLELTDWAGKYNLPIVVMGHSYGSFLTQRLISLSKTPIAFILSGSNYMKSPLFTLGAIIAKMACNKDPKAPGITMANLSFKAYEKQIPGTNNWLSRNEEVVARYNDDPACGYVASNNFYSTFMQGIKLLYTREAQASVDKDKPIYIFSGSCDPVGDNGVGPTKLLDYYKRIGCENVTLKIYQECRHEMLNEINNTQVYADVLSFLNNLRVN